MSRTSKALVTLILIGIFGMLVWQQLPRGFDTDITRVGNGQPAVVLAFENHSLLGMEVMDLLNAIRDDYEHHVAFLVADLGTPQGQAFARRHEARDGTVLLFSGDGTRIDTIVAPEDEQSIRDRLARNPGF